MSVSTDRAQPWAEGADQDKAPHVMQCPDSPTPGHLPANMECAVLVRQAVGVLAKRSVVWRLETFTSIPDAQKAQLDASVIVETGGQIWLMTLGQRGQRSPGGHFVGEVGPLNLPSAPNYEMLIAQAHTAADAMTAPQTSSGPEAWFVIGGKQCVETPSGVQRAGAGEGMFAPADTPLQLTVLGPEVHDAFFIVVHDPNKPWRAKSNWQPKGLCAAAASPTP